MTVRFFGILSTLGCLFDADMGDAPPSNSYITEDASSHYITEDGLSYYVTEA